MRQQIYRNIATIVGGVVFSFIIYAFPVHAVQPIDDSIISKHITLQQLGAQAAHVSGSWNALYDVPRYIRLQGLQTHWNSSDPLEKTYQFLEENKQLYKLTEPKQQLKLLSTHQDDIGMTHLALQQYVQDVPVYNATLIFHFRKDGSLSSVHGTPVSNLANITIQPTLSKQQAFTRAQDHSTIKHGQGNLKLLNAELVVYDQAVVGEGKSYPVLTWKLSIVPQHTLFSEEYFINAQDGSIIKTASNVSQAFDEETYVYSNCNVTETLTYDETGLVAAIDDTDASAVHENVSDTYTYLADETKFGVETAWFDDNSFLYPITSYTDYMTPVDEINCEDTFKAAWSNSLVHYSTEFVG